MAYKYKGFLIKVFSHNCVHSRVEIWKGGIKCCEKIIGTSYPARAARRAVDEYLSESNN